MLFSPIVPFEDEHLTSIIERLFIYLGYERLSIFYKSIYRSCLRRYDYFPIYHPLLKIFDLLGPCDYSEIILKHTEYSFLAPLSYKLDSLRFISAMFDSAGVSFKSRTQKIKRCPECDKEKSYVRRSHNLPGVTVCYKHKCSLVVDGDEINTHITQYDIKYAIYAKDFAEACFDFSWADINKYIEINTTAIKTKSLSQKLEMVMNVFPSVSDISIITNTPSIKTNEYDVLYSSNNLVELICKKCGKHFCTTSLGYNIDFLCPVCQKAFTDEELNENRFMKATKGKFKQISGSIFLNTSSKVLHEDCMILHYVDNCAFVENPVCRYCERKETPNFKNLLPGYKILGVINHKYILQNETSKEKLSMYTCEVNKLSVKLNAKKTRWTLDEMSSEITRLGYKCLSSYSFDDEMKLLCKRGHISNRTFSSLRQSPECSECCKLRRLKSSPVFGRINFHFRSEEIFSLEDAKKLLINKKATNTFKELVDEKFIHSLAPGYYSLNIEKLSGEEIADKYYINGYRHHGFYVSYTFWEKLEEIDMPKKDCIFACTSAVEEKKITFVNKQKFQLMPFPEYYSDDRKLETQLVFSLNNVKYPPKTMEKIIELARFYVKNNSLDKKFINKYSKVKLYEKKIRKNKKKT